MLFALLALTQNVSFAQTADTTSSTSDISLDDNEDYGIDTSSEEDSIVEESTDESFE